MNLLRSVVQTKLKPFGLKPSSQHAQLVRLLTQIWQTMHPTEQDGPPSPVKKAVVSPPKKKKKEATRNTPPRTAAWSASDSESSSAGDDLESRFRAMIVEDEDVWLRVLRFEVSSHNLPRRSADAGADNGLPPRYLPSLAGIFRRDCLAGSRSEHQDEGLAQSPQDLAGQPGGYTSSFSGSAAALHSSAASLLLSFRASPTLPRSRLALASDTPESACVSRSHVLFALTWTLARARAVLALLHSSFLADDARDSLIKCKC